MRIDSSGNVGIGTSAPGAKLDVSAGTNLNLGVTQLTLNNYSNDGVGITFSRTSSDDDLMALGVADTDKLGMFSREGLVFATGGATNYTATTERMRIDSSGNVGIGTISPSARLNVGGGSLPTSGSGYSLGISSALGATRLTTDASSKTNFIGSFYDDTAIEISQGVTSGYVSGIVIGGRSATNATVSDAIALYTRSLERMRIDSSGNVGIGTSSSGAKLEVSGDIRTSIGSGGTLSLFETTTPRANHLVLGSDGSGSYINATYATGGSGIMRFQTESSERMRIDSSGNVGIGTTSPTQKLDIVGIATKLSPSDQTANVYSFFVNNGGTTYIGRDNSAGTGFGGAAYASVLYSSGAYPLEFFTNGTERMRITSAGEVWIAGTTDRGAFNLQCNGTGVWGAGAYTNGSDARIKEEIEPISSSLEVVNKLNPVTFKYKEDWSSDRATQTGFIAQELQEALADEVYIDGVVNDTSEYMSVAYQNIIPILTKAIQELSAKVTALEAQLNKE
jgi:hypothetical protein